MKKSTLILLFYTIPTFCLFGYHRAQHPLNRPQENSSLFRLLQNNPRIKNASQVAFLGMMIAYARMLNKSYEPHHFDLKQACAPDNVISSPFKCIDDGFIGHPGSGHLPPYGLMGISWNFIPKIDNTLIVVDNAQRKTQAWVQWLQNNVRSLEDQSTVERWWNQARNWIS